MSSDDLKNPNALMLLRSFAEARDRAYCEYIDLCGRPECCGVDAKIRTGTFTRQDLDAHRKASEALGRHRACAQIVRDLTGGIPREAVAAAGLANPAESQDMPLADAQKRLRFEKEYLCHFGRCLPPCPSCQEGSVESSPLGVRCSACGWRSWKDPVPGAKPTCPPSEPILMEKKL